MNEASWLTTIRRDPSDLTRLVYADWLDEKGDADAATLIRVQVELTACCCRKVIHHINGDPGDRRPENIYRLACESCRGMFPEESRCIESLAVPGVTCVYDRGLVTGVTADTMATLYREGPGLLRRHPVTRVIVVNKRPGALVWSSEGDRYFYWLHEGSEDPYAVDRGEYRSSREIPRAIWDLLRGGSVGLYTEWETREAAISALSAALSEYLERNA